MKNTILINIGLNVAGQPPLSLREALAVLMAERISVMAYAEHQSATEPTLVAHVILPQAPDTRHPASEGDLTALARVALRLKQDAIAVWLPDAQDGTLVGPDAAKWGPFNPEFFLALDGRKLSAVLKGGRQ